VRDARHSAAGLYTDDHGGVITTILRGQNGAIKKTARIVRSDWFSENLMKPRGHVDEMVHGRVLEVNLHGKLTRADYDNFVPTTEKLIRRFGKIRILVTMREFDGWDAGGLWEDLKWDAKHFNDVERVALVGDEEWQKWMAGICQPFTTAEVRHFRFDQLAEAHAWLSEP
jgi:hypothetical protein